MPLEQSIKYLVEQAKNSEAYLWLNLAGTLASILGLAISFWVLIVTRGVRRFFYHTSRVPALHNQIQQYRAAVGLWTKQKSLPNLLEEIKSGFPSCISNLNSLREKVPRKYRGRIKTTLKLMEKSKSTLTESEIMAVYSELGVIENDIRNWLDDNRMEATG